MGQTTSRLGLNLPGGGSHGDITPPELADIDVLNDDLRKLEAGIGWILVTSSTRPSSPYLGMPIFETDTGNGYLWNGGGWKQVLNTTQLNQFTGTTAQRDSYYGTPGTGATAPEITARVTLANAGSRWFNTEKGWEEQYFAKVGDTGALSSTVALNPGWYPSGAGVKPEQGFVLPTTGYGVGTSIITTQPNVVTIWKKGIGFVDPPLNGTGTGVRMVIPIEGNYRLDAYGNFNSSIINLMLKQNSVSADATGAFVGDSGAGVNSSNFRSLSTIGSFSVNDFVTLAWYAQVAGAGTNVRWSITWDSVRTS